MTKRPTSISELPEGYSALLKIEGGDADRHQARADQLAGVLSGLQRMAYLLAAHDQGLAIAERLKPGKAVKEAYALLCGTSQEGSYALPIAEAQGVQAELDFVLPKTGLLERIREIWEQVANAEQQGPLASFSSDISKRILREIQKILPREQEGISLSLSTDSLSKTAKLDWRANKFVKSQLEGPAQTDAVMTVTGELLSINFAERKVVILYPATRQEISCTYLPDVEETLIEGRKEPIQVTGKFVLDSQGIPQRLMDVSSIEPVDLSPIVITTVPAFALKLRQPLELQPFLDDESQQYLCVAAPEIGLDAFALNRQQLFDEIHEQLGMLWVEYAQEANERLDNQAQRLKEALKNLIEEVIDAQK